MDLTLYLHPLASFCHKVTLALYENQTPFEARVVDFGDPASSAELRAVWPVGKIPVLRDHARQQTVAETTIIIEYIAQHYPGAAELIPKDPEQAHTVRLWDRFFDLYVQLPMQKVVGDRLRPAGQGDPYGVKEAIEALGTAYDMLDRQLGKSRWAGGNAISMADCAAAPSLFFAHIVRPFGREHSELSDYFERLVQWPAFQRVLDEARPYFANFPLIAQMPARFR